MKAALEAWGTKTNLFHQGVARASKRAAEGDRLAPRQARAMRMRWGHVMFSPKIEKRYSSISRLSWYSNRSFVQAKKLYNMVRRGDTGLDHIRPGNAAF